MTSGSEIRACGSCEPQEVARGSVVVGERFGDTKDTEDTKGTEGFPGSVGVGELFGATRDTEGTWRDG